MFTILQISDLHFGPPYVAQVGEALLRIAADLKPGAVVVCGDLTQRAKREQFLAAREFIDRLPDVPRLVVPGNHDVPLYRVRERWQDPLGLYKRLIAPDLNQVLRLDSAVIIGLDSTAPRRSIANGRIHLWQLDLCSEALADAPPEAARIVVAHHHFAPAPDYLHDWTMPRAKRAMTRFVELGVEMILGGHLHRAFIGNSLDFFPGTHRERGIIISQSGTATSRRGRGREREKNSFNLIEIDSDTLSITHFMYFIEESGFAPVSHHVFRRPGRHVGSDDLRQSAGRHLL
jgi:3',5'-cyclic AMP phosphodiesterase CpdA